MKIQLLLYVLILIFLFPKPAHAYLDPGTGSYFFQILIAGLLGTLFFLKSTIKKLRKFFENIFSNKTTQKAIEDDEDR